MVSQTLPASFRRAVEFTEVQVLVTVLAWVRLRAATLLPAFSV
jgi:hypothetical protein